MNTSISIDVGRLNWSRWLMGLALWLFASLAIAQVNMRNFDHVKTGFPLTGAHLNERCESCHINGVFKGTPRDCASCHTSGSRYAKTNIVKTQNHFQTTLGCETCHSEKTFTGANFDHAGVTPGSCSNCHNGVITAGKSATHVSTTQPCDACHKVTTWVGAKPDHSGFTSSTNCASCHNGTQASGKSSTHIPTPAGMDCDSCHAVTAWNPGFFHKNVSVTGQCASCHNNGSQGATQKPNTPTHAGVTGNCEQCHSSTTNWATATFVHGTANAIGTGTCDTCHNGSTNSVSKGVQHIPVTTGPSKCDSCHQSQTIPGGFTGAYTMNHLVVTATSCATCHSGGYKAEGTSGAFAKPTNHIAYQSLPVSASANCDTCHKAGYVSWAGGTFHKNFTVSTQCATCHYQGGLGATQMPNTATHANVTGNCETCHKSTSTWSGATYVHTAANALGTGTCDTCHNGTTALGKATQHIPVTTGVSKCDSCHQSQVVPGGFTGAYTMNHAVVTATTCATCHNGGYTGEGTNGATSKPTNHIAYQSITVAASAGCNACHTSGYVSWTGGTFHKNFSVSTQCATCHYQGGLGATQMPNTATHANVTGNCESCHKSTSTWSGATYVHTAANALGTGTCDTCHNGTTALGKATQHIPVTTGVSKCDSCHQSQVVPGGFTGAYTMNHAVVTATTCATCHNGGYTGEGTNGATSKPTNHIAYQSIAVAASAGCNACHTSGYVSWTGGTFHKNFSVSTQCATCHYQGGLGATQMPNTATHANVTGNCETCHKSTSTWSGATYVHTAANALGTGTCDTCHNGTTALGKATQHIPVTTGVSKCDSCHQSQVVPGGFTMAYTMNHSVVTTTTCATCHNGGYTGEGTNGATGKPSNHIMYTSIAVSASAGCNACHTSGYVSWTGGTFHKNFSVSTQCATCHYQGGLGATQMPNTATHAGVTGNCENCHKSTSVWSGATYVHAAANQLGTGTCDTCHNGTTALGKATQHIPVTTGVSKCDSCHQSQVVPGGFTMAYTMNHSVVTTTTCATCHNGGYTGEGTNGAMAKTTNHIPYQSVTVSASAGCNNCHTSGFVSWTGGTYHKNYSVTAQCATCHYQSTYGVTAMPNTATHSGVTGNCENCHKSTSAWTSVTYVHAAANLVGSGTCGNCHNGTTALGKAAQHIPVTGIKCDDCHKSQTVPGGFNLATMNHSVVTATACKTCHNGSYTTEGTTGALATTSVKHVPYATNILAGTAMDCNACHSSTVAFTTEKMNHNGTQGNGAGWCKGCHASGLGLLGNMQTKSVTHNKAGSTDCSQSGCHKPLGTKGNLYSSWD